MSTIQVTAKLLELRFCQHLKASPLKVSRFRNPTCDLRSSKLVTFAALRVSGSHVVPWYVMGLPKEREVHLHLHHTVGYGIHDDSRYSFLVFFHAGLGMFAIFGRMKTRL